MRPPVTPTFIETLKQIREPQQPTRHWTPVRHRHGVARSLVGLVRQVRLRRTRDAPAPTPLEEQVQLDRIPRVTAE